MELVLILSWVLLALGVGCVWSARGRSFGAGVFMSLVLSPVIGLILGLLGDSNARACPVCGAPVLADTVTCRHCYHDLPAAESPQGKPTPSACRFCGNTVPAGAARCPICAGNVAPWSQR